MVQTVATDTRSIRILVVDDFEPFRRFVYSMLRRKRHLQVICEASDGLEAVQKAEELKPDLILLDVGLPTLNGIEAARRIRKLVPRSKILFLSQESDPSVVQEALGLGALGYILKTQARNELLVGVEAVIRDEQFVSSQLAGHDFEGNINWQAPDSFTSRPAENTEVSRCHEVQFYSNDSIFLDTFTRFICAALRAGKSTIVVATRSHRDSLLERLQAEGLDVDSAIEEGRYIPLDVAETLSTFMVNAMPDTVRFLRAARDLVAAATKVAKGEPPAVAACGECAPLLWAERNSDAAIRVEQLWDEIAKLYDVEILCGYPLDSFHGEEDSHTYQRVCAEHSAVHSH